LIALILHICNNKKIMGTYTNGRRANVLGMLTLLVMSAAAVMLVWLYLRGG
jgi:Mn2+/Fe2+ NRAMP family transporter